MRIKIIFICIGLLLLSGCSKSSSNESLSGNYDYYLYFSTTMDKYVTSGRLVGVGEENQVILKTEGLELGKISQLNQKVYISDRGYDFVYTPRTGGIDKIKRKMKEHTGVDSAEVDGNIIKVFNHGYAEDGSYHTNFYVGDEVLVVEEFISVIGNDNNNLYSIGDKETGELFVNRYYSSEGKLVSENIGSFPDTEEYHISYNLVVQGDYLYAVAFDKNHRAGIFRYSLTDRSYTFKEIDQEIKIDDIGFAYAKGIFTYQNSLLYFSGNGTIYFIDMERMEISKKFETDLELDGLFIVTPIDQYNVAIANYDQKGNILIWTLNLKELEVKKDRTIDASLWSDSEYLYDFQVSK